MKTLLRLFGCVALAATALPSCRSAVSPEHVVLTTATQLQQVFNADSGKVRAIFLASPTCGLCLRGAEELHRVWLAKDSSRDVAVYVVWSPQLGATEANVPGGAGLVPDGRARHFWDPGEVVGTAFDSLLDLPLPAWDTWMLFDRTARWGPHGPPAPTWWEHQLSAGPPNLHLDPARFASHALALTGTR